MPFFRRPLTFVTSLLLPFLLIACSAPTPVATRPAVNAPATTRSALPYITPQQFDFHAILSPPPADNSAMHSREVVRMLALQDSRTPEDVRRCRAEETVTVFAFDTVLGPSFNATNLPVTAALMHEVFVEARSVSGAAKQVWVRTRPPLANPQIHPCVEFENSPSYPSGHAVRGMVWAVLLSEIYPEHRAALMARGRQIGDDRYLAGMHYPTDVAAGQKLGAVIAHRLLANPAFRARLDQAEAECHAETHAAH